MRTSAILNLLVLAVSIGMQAETIVLKNGTKIVVDSVHEENGKVRYEIGDDSYAIPKSAVDHIDSFGSASASRRSAAVPDFVPKTTEPTFSSNVSVNVIKDDRVDDAEVAKAEASGDDDVAAVANAQAGRFSLEQGDRDAAVRYFDRALRFEPNNATVLINYAATLVRIGRPQDGLPLAERAVRAAPESPDAWAVLGYARLQADRAKDAVTAFEKSLRLRPDPGIQEFLARARREASAGADFVDAESAHFTLRFEGHSVQSGLTRSILEQLDGDYDSLVSELGTAPAGSITVILYPEKDFFDVTHAPTWSTALNDGKLQIPIRGLTQMNGELARVLRHELTHSFVNQISRGRCPLWLNEGVAQLMEPRTTASAGSMLARVFSQQKEVPLSSLEQSLLGLDDAGAAIAYAESLAAVEYIHETYGMSDVRRLLERIGRGDSTEAALRGTFNVGYGQFEQDIATYLTSKYGN
jgi:tetratricopeptide (TPR) repeat protein